MPVYLQNSSFQKNVIFIHIPRTGGVHLQSVLKQAFDARTIVSTSEIQPGTFGHYACDNVIVALSKIDGKFDREDYFIFTFVRNPFDRILSSYLNYTIRNMPDFGDYIKMVERVVKNKIYYLQASINTNDLAHYIPQSEMIGENQPDFIGRFENFQEEGHRLYDITGIDVLNQVKIRKRQIDYREYYSFENRRIIEDIYQEDLERFAYSF